MEKPGLGMDNGTDNLNLLGVSYINDNSSSILPACLQ